MGTTVEQETAMREALVKEHNEAKIKAKAHKPLKVGARAFFLLNGASNAVAARIKTDAGN